MQRKSSSVLLRTHNCCSKHSSYKPYGQESEQYIKKYFHNSLSSFRFTRIQLFFWHKYETKAAQKCTVSIASGTSGFLPSATCRPWLLANPHIFSAATSTGVGKFNSFIKSPKVFLESDMSLTRHSRAAILC